MRYLTVVYKIEDDVETVEDITSHPAMTICSWSNAIHDRDDAMALARDAIDECENLRDILSGFEST
jgi:hypothetical protein